MANKIWDEDGEYVEDFADADLRGKDIKRAENKSKIGLGANMETIVGICVKCNNYSYIENDAHKVILSGCTSFEIPLGKNKIKSCSRFANKGALSLSQMYEMATLIDLDNIKEKAGFIK